MDKFNLSFCDDFKYPPEIKDLIGSFCEILCRNLRDDLSSILLLGSASRGELTYIFDQEGDLIIYSDLEFFVYIKKKINPSTLKNIFEEVSNLEKPFSKKSRFFHFDFCFAPHKRPKRRKYRFITFETKSTGKTIYGIDMTSILPSMDRTSLTFKELNEVLLHRLWSMLLYLPETFLKNRADCPDLNYILSRNVLDITTWLLPYEHKELIAGFKNRLDFIHANWDNLGFKQYFTGADLRFLQECYDGKMHLKFYYPSLEMYKKAMDIFISASIFMLNKNGYTADRTTYRDSIAAHSVALFEGQTLKRKIVDLYMIRNKAMYLSPGILLRWILQDKRALSVLFCLNMHLASISYIKGNDDCMNILQTAGGYLKKLNPDWKQAAGDYLAKWLHMRKGYVDYLIAYERGYQSKKDYFYSIINVKLPAQRAGLPGN